MNLENQRKLEQLLDMGYVIIIGDHPFVDTPVTSISDYEPDESDLDEYYDHENIQKVYSDGHYEDRMLSTVDVGSVRVLQPLNWLSTEFKPEETCSDEFIDEE